MVFLPSPLGLGKPNRAGWGGGRLGRAGRAHDQAENRMKSGPPLRAACWLGGGHIEGFTVKKLTPFP